MKEDVGVVGGGGPAHLSFEGEPRDQARDQRHETLSPPTSKEVGPYVSTVNNNFDPKDGNGGWRREYR